ncbi:hypothetical protein PCANC_22936 [Puccinia coronata f. sp. avenae]|uniref:DUF659 domain-containing protein n=1 Tax=Puccinia coronata f. sp. avenae TaxID=200324 RepID=A0A2N5TLV8_9BASI|nr:hypothetical protein PCANC_22936 [Puccinia coronata f. sp. avenae]
MTKELIHTKNFHEHLLKVHRLVDPKLTNKIDKSQTNIARWTQTSQLVPKVVLNSDTLKTAIAYFIVKADLPFSVVEHDKYHMVDLTIAIPHVQGSHTGKNFADLFHGVLMEYDCLSKIHTITANNASTNGKMARELQLLLPSFNTDKQLLGCIAHVINLGAKAGLAVLGTLDNNNGKEISMAEMDSSESSLVMSILNLTLVPDGIGLDLKTVLKQIHGLCTYAASLPHNASNSTR